MANGTLAASQIEMLSQSGTGIITITPPATNTNRAITLPDAAGAIVVSGTTPSLNGITFPATQSASAGANTLDDYEEGTWTISTSASGYTISAQSAYYTKIGNVVHIFGKVTFSAVNGSANSAVLLTGLPFTNNGNTAVPGVARDNSVSGAIYVLTVALGASTLELNSMDGVPSGTQRTIRINESYLIGVSYFV
jgi:hypothetical protein